MSNNKKHFELDDKDWLKNERRSKSCAQIAREIGCFHYSVAYACRFFTVEEQREFKQERLRKKPETI